MEKSTYDRLMNRMGDRIAGISKDQYLKENVPLCWVRFAVADIIVPEIAFEMAKNSEMVVRGARLLEIVEACLKKAWPKAVLRYYGFMVDGEVTRLALKERGAVWILEDLMQQVGILEESSPGYFNFTYPDDRELFIAMAMCNRLVIAAQSPNCKNL